MSSTSVRLIIRDSADLRSPAPQRRPPRSSKPRIHDSEHWAGVLGAQGILAGDAAFIFHVRIQNFGHRYRERLQRSKNIDLGLHAPVTRARLEGAACAAVEIRTLDGDDLAIRADHFVLAAGGVENPRLLLLSSGEAGGTPGNAGGLVGRYFTDHSYVDPGTLVLRALDSLEFYWPRPVVPSRGASSVRGVLSLRRDVVERERLMNAACSSTRDTKPIGSSRPRK